MKQPIIIPVPGIDPAHQSSVAKTQTVDMRAKRHYFADAGNQGQHHMVRISRQSVDHQSPSKCTRYNRADSSSKRSSQFTHILDIFHVHYEADDLLAGRFVKVSFGHRPELVLHVLCGRDMNASIDGLLFCY